MFEWWQVCAKHFHQMLVTHSCLEQTRESRVASEPPLLMFHSSQDHPSMLQAAHQSARTFVLSLVMAACSEIFSLCHRSMTFFCRRPHWHVSHHQRHLMMMVGWAIHWQWIIPHKLWLQASPVQEWMSLMVTSKWCFVVLVHPPQ